jgi:putative membrane protein
MTDLNMSTWIWMMLIMIVMFGGLGAIGWWLIRTHRGEGPDRFDKARQILAERYARGEITTAEYNERLNNQ